MGMQWARMMTILGAMQGYGRPGVQLRQPAVRRAAGLQLLFPRLRRGQLLRRPAVQRQRREQLPAHAAHRHHELGAPGIPRIWFPEAITKGKAMGYLTDVTSDQGQFFPFGYPSPGHVPVEMLYKYGSQLFGTMVDGNRWVRDVPAREPQVRRQPVGLEGRRNPFADVILPACTVFEKWDIGEWYNVGAGYVHHMYSMNNHRVISLQHKCIEPLGESMSDYDIFPRCAEARPRRGVFRGRHHRARLVQARVRLLRHGQAHQSWRQFLKKGYFVVPSDPEPRARPPRTAGFTRAARRTRPSPIRCRRTTSAATSARACRRRRASSSSSPRP
jgi:anaerobic selenocysteine-containing dehydrogenase